MENYFPPSLMNLCASQSQSFFIAGLKIRREKHLTVINYVFILALDNFVGFKYSHAWKNKYEHPGIKHSA